MPTIIRGRAGSLREEVNGLVRNSTVVGCRVVCDLAVIGCPQLLGAEPGETIRRRLDGLSRAVKTGGLSVRFLFVFMFVLSQV